MNISLCLRKSTHTYAYAYALVKISLYMLTECQSNASKTDNTVNHLQE